MALPSREFLQESIDRLFAVEVRDVIADEVDRTSAVEIDVRGPIGQELHLTVVERLPDLLVLRRVSLVSLGDEELGGVVEPGLTEAVRILLGGLRLGSVDHRLIQIRGAHGRLRFGNLVKS